MTSYFSRLSPVPAFPSYTGPHTVGTLDVEFPVSGLDSPSPAPVDDIATIQYRIFYPCESNPKTNPIHWIPSPQRGYVSAYTRFLGAGSILAEFISFFPRILHYITIPAYKNAPLLSPGTSDARWPVVIFSHGLGGSRNAYSHLCGSIASHGVIVIAPEHRDGSTPISYIREIPTGEKTGEKPPPKHGKQTVDYYRVSHTPSPKVEAARNEQLMIRLWELGLIHESLLKMEQSQQPVNLNTTSVSLSMFRDKMDVHTPGKITFAGHSFGAATVAQFVKSTYYSPQNSKAPEDYQPLFTPSFRSAITQQITPNTPVILLDVWCLPLRSEATRWLWDKPFPCYSQNGPGGEALLAVESQAFFKWRVHLKATKLLLSPDPSSQSSNYTKSDGDGEYSKPHFYYASTAAHLSQSDFGVLFPWMVKKLLAVEEPDRLMRLNVRAVLQLLRTRGIEVSVTSAADQEVDGKAGLDTKNDALIFRKNEEVRGWNWLDTDVTGMGDMDDEASAKGTPASTAASSQADLTAEPMKVVVGNELMKENSTTSVRV